MLRERTRGASFQQIKNFKEDKIFVCVLKRIVTFLFSAVSF